MTKQTKQTKEEKKAYQDILSVCEKHRDLPDVGDMITTLKGHLILIEWEEKYGIKIEGFNPCQYDCYRVNDYVLLSYFKDAKLCKEEHRGRSISWEDNNKQPDDGWILSIGFSTGAYIFGEDYNYQQDLFQKFFNELKTYNPDFIDSHNHYLYWKIENCKEIFYRFNEILKKYKEINQRQLKDREIKKLKEKLQDLENN